MTTKTLELLSHVEGLVAARAQARALYAEQIAPGFTPFEFLDTHETALSRVLAWMLDPQGSHAQGARFLTTFLEWADAPELAGATDWSTANVRTEVATVYSGQGGFLDVLVKAGTFGIAIENKPFAADQRLQVNRYLSDLTRRCPGGHCLIYLSSNGDGPSETSLSTDLVVSEQGAGRLRIRSYPDLISWLEICAGSCRAPSVATLVRGFATYIEREFKGVGNKEEAEHLAETIASNPERLNAALALFEAQDATRERLIARFVADVSARVSDRAGWTLARADLGSSANSGVLVGLPGVKARFGIQFDQSAYRYLFYGVEVPGGGRVEPKVKAVIQAHLGKGGVTEWWPFWRKVQPNDRYFPIDPSLDREFWLMLSDGRLAGMVMAFVDEIEERLRTT